MIPEKALKLLLENPSADVNLEDTYSSASHVSDHGEHESKDNDHDGEFEEQNRASSQKPGPSTVVLSAEEPEREPVPKRPCCASSGQQSDQASETFTLSVTSPCRGEGEGEDQDARPPSSIRPQLQASTRQSTQRTLASLSPDSATVRPREAVSTGIRGGRTGSLSTSPASHSTDATNRWRDRSEPDTLPNAHLFRPTRTPGPVLDKTASWTVLQLFQLFFNDATAKTIIDNTNAQAERQRKAGINYQWTILSMKEFYSFLATILNIGLCSKKSTLDNWMAGVPFNSSVPRSTMTEARFETIDRTLQLCDPEGEEENDQKKGTPDYDRLFKIKPLYNELVSACQSFYHPYKNISISERMVPSCDLQRKHRHRAVKRRYKLHALVDSNGYTWNFFVHTIKSSKTSERSLSYSSVMQLLEFSALGTGYNLYVDDFYTCPALFRELSQKGIGACGTIPTSHSGFPKASENNLPRNAARGDMRWLRDGKLLFVKWMDNCEATVCSTVHEAYSGKTVRRKVKREGEWKTTQVPCPDVVLDYNKYMTGEDLSNDLICYYSVRQEIKKWYNTFFYYFLDMAIVNAHILHQELVRENKDLSKLLTQKAFRERLVREMLAFAENISAEVPAMCLPCFYEENASDSPQYCKWCADTADKQVVTLVHCKKCQVPLCLTTKNNCFVAYHDAQRK